MSFRLVRGDMNSLCINVGVFSAVRAMLCVLKIISQSWLCVFGLEYDDRIGVDTKDTCDVCGESMWEKNES